MSMKVRIADLAGTFRTSPFIKNMFVVMSGTVLAQALGFVVSPVLSRLFSPADFGVFGAFNAVISIIVSIVTLEYGNALLLPKEDADAANLLSLSFVIIGAIGLLCAVCALAAPGTVGGLMKSSGAWPLVLLVASTMAEGVNLATQAWAIRRKAFKRTSASQIVRGISSNGTKIGLGFLRTGALGLLIGQVLGGILASASLLRVVLPDIRALRTSIRWSRMKEMAKEYRDFPIFSGSQNFINALSSGLPVLIFNKAYGLAAAGAFAFSSSVLAAPMSFLGVALRQVLFQKACEYEHQGRPLSSLYVRVTAGLVALIILPTIFLIIAAPALFTLVFGSQWRLAGQLAQSLIIWLAVSFCNVPAVLFAKVIRIQRFSFFFDLVHLAGRVLVLWLGGIYLTVHQTVFVFAMLGTAMNLFLILYVGRAVMKREGSAGWSNLIEVLKGD